LQDRGFCCYNISLIRNLPSRQSTADGYFGLRPKPEPPCILLLVLCKLLVLPTMLLLLLPILRLLPMCYGAATPATSTDPTALLPCLLLLLLRLLLLLLPILLLMLLLLTLLLLLLCLLLLLLLLHTTGATHPAAYSAACAFHMSLQPQPCHAPYSPTPLNPTPPPTHRPKPSPVTS
jgi:hypothetical protein